MEIATEMTAEGSNTQNNIISIRNTREGHFLYFDTIGVNSFEGFRIFEEKNNNNLLLKKNNNNLLPLPEFEGELKGKLNLLSSRENLRGLDPNIVALINALIGANLGINHIERESNHVKLIDLEKWKQRILMNG